jgi:hypothetical protein
LVEKEGYGGFPAGAPITLETLVSTRSRVGASHINLPRLKKKKEEKMKKTTEEGAKNTDMVWIYKTE